MIEDYDRFIQWYASRARHWETALSNVHTSLSGYLDEELDNATRPRVRVGQGRVKGLNRLWAKVTSEKYSREISTTEDIEREIDDLVGIRVVCTNQSDADRAAELVSRLPECPSSDHPVLEFEGGSIRDYWADPKPSGYRAYHLNVVTSVIQSVTRVPVRCEVQIRTLLQDSWGELTHEDTYKPGSEVPPIVATLSGRLAQLLFTLDGVAQDIRNELRANTAVAVEAPEPLVVLEPSGSHEALAKPAVAGSTERAVHGFLRTRYETLQKPLELAALAEELQREFGWDIARGWLGRESFKTLLRNMLPDALIFADPPSYLLPAGFDPNELIASRTRWATAYGSNKHMPAMIVLMRKFDSDFPLLSPSMWAALFVHLGIALDEVIPHENSIRYVNEVSRRARDLSSREVPISRRHFDFVLKPLLFGGHLVEKDLSLDSARRYFMESIFARAASIGVTVSEADRASVAEWLGETAPPVEVLTE